jgi:hypothetical protein
MDDVGTVVVDIAEVLGLRKENIGVVKGRRTRTVSRRDGGESSIDFVAKDVRALSIEKWIT